MDALNILNQLHEDGVRSLVDGDDLVLIPITRVRPELLPYIISLERSIKNELRKSQAFCPGCYPRMINAIAERAFERST